MKRCLRLIGMSDVPGFLFLESNLRTYEIGCLCVLLCHSAFLRQLFRRKLS